MLYVTLTLTLSPQGRGKRCVTLTLTLSPQGRGKRCVTLTLTLSPPGRGKRCVTLTLTLSPQGRGKKSKRQPVSVRHRPAHHLRRWKQRRALPPCASTR